MKPIWPLSFVIAHRGAPQLAPENTIAALTMAKQSGAQWVECDIQFTKDYVPVIFHDITLERTTNGHGGLSTASMEKIKSLDAGNWFSPQFKNERVPTLQEWLQTANNLQLKLNLEIKPANKKDAVLLAGCVIAHLKKYWPAYPHSIFISSSDLFMLMQIAKHTNQLPLGLIFEKILTEKNAINLVRNNIISVHQPYKILNKKYIDALHNHGLHVLAYTVNDLVRAHQLRDMGIDGIFSDNEKLWITITLTSQQSLAPST